MKPAVAFNNSSTLPESCRTRLTIQTRLTLVQIIIFDDIQASEWLLLFMRWQYLMFSKSQCEMDFHKKNGFPGGGDGSAIAGDRAPSAGNIRTTSFTMEGEWMQMTVFEDGERIKESLMAGVAVLLVESGDLGRLTKFTGDDNNDGAIMPAIELQAMKHIHLARISSVGSRQLSPREKEVLELLASGLFYREVGKKLNIGMETVRTHVKSICSKMRVRNRVEAVAKYNT
jgi:DNA-binding NarL/FixJ family response regulator